VDEVKEAAEGIVDTARGILEDAGGIATSMKEDMVPKTYSGRKKLLRDREVGGVRCLISGAIYCVGTGDKI